MKNGTNRRDYTPADETSAVNFLSEDRGLSKNEHIKFLDSFCEIYMQIGMYKNAFEIYRFILFLYYDGNLVGLHSRIISEIKIKALKAQQAMAELDKKL